jgi:hypothetical protein
MQRGQSKFPGATEGAQSAQDPHPHEALLSLLSRKEKEIHDALEAHRRIRERLHPEQLKALTRIATRLAELQRYIELGPRSPAPYTSLQNLVERVSRTLNVDAAWELAEKLKIEELWFIPPERLWSLLEVESRFKPHVASDHWSAAFAQEEVQTLRAEFNDCLATGKPLPQTWRDLSVERLATLYEVRADSFRHSRALAGLRTKYFHTFFGVLAVLLLLSVGLLGFTSLVRSWSELYMLFAALAAGALGAALSGTYKLRDTLTSIRELRSNKPALTIQPLVGAVAAFVLYVILRSELVIIAGFGRERLGWEQFMVFGFLAGFSEPFFLGIVNRLSRLGESRRSVAEGGAAAVASPAQSVPSSPALGVRRPFAFFRRLTVSH